MIYNSRSLYFLGFLACTGMMSYALYAEYILHLIPCPLCVLQRLAVSLTGVIFLIASIHNPRKNTKPRANYAKDYMATFQQSANSQAQKPSTGQQKKTSDFGSYDPASFGGSMYNQGWGNMVNWGNKFKDNEAIQGWISGSRLDSNQTMMNMGMDLLYQKGQLSQMADYQGGMENLKTGNTLKLLAAEGGITRDLMWDQGDIKSRQIGEQGTEDRAQIRTLGTENRLTRMTEGDQTRKTQRDKYREDRKMRADARGAITRTGSKFFG